VHGALLVANPGQGNHRPDRDHCLPRLSLECRNSAYARRRGVHLCHWARLTQIRCCLEVRLTGPRGNDLHANANGRQDVVPHGP